MVASCEYLQKRVEKVIREYKPNERKIRMLKNELALLDKKRDNLKAVDTEKQVNGGKHERKSAIDRFVADKEDAKELILLEIKRMEDENAKIECLLKTVGEPYGSLLKWRYLKNEEWPKVAMEIGYSVDYTNKELRKKSLNLAVECLFPLIGLMDYD